MGYNLTYPFYGDEEDFSERGLLIRRDLSHIVP